MSIIEESDFGTSVFKDEAKLHFDYVPDTLPTREAEAQRLASIFRGVLDGTSAAHAHLRGPVGTGKTAIAKAFVRDIREIARKKGRVLESAYVNCRTRKSDALVLLKILRHFDPGFPERGYSVPEMLESLRKLVRRKETHLVVILDEVDALLGGETDLFYQFTRFDAEEPGRPTLSLIAVSQGDIHGKLDAASASTFPRTNVIELAPYGLDAMRKIVDQRAALAFQKGTVSPDVKELVADIAAKKGDARLAIEILRHAGVTANDEGKTAVEPEHVRLAKSHLYSELPEYKLKELPLHELLTLAALCRSLVHEGGAYVITGNLEKSYKGLCEENGEKPRAHTQFYNYLKSLEKVGFLDLKLSGKGQAGTTQYVSLPDASAAQLGEVLEDLLKDRKGKGG